MAWHSDKSNPLAIPQGAKVLYSQNSNDAHAAINSQDFTCGSRSPCNDQGADDFVIPKGRTWTIRAVDVTGAYYNGSGPATSENVIFYKDKGGIPGTPVKNGTFANLNGTGGPDFAVALPGKGLQLNAGHYWVSVIANQAFDCCGQWGWEVNSVQHRDQAMWQEPPDHFGYCPTWGTIENCLGSPGPDLMFDLRGTSKGK